MFDVLDIYTAEVLRFEHILYICIFLETKEDYEHIYYISNICLTVLFPTADLAQNVYDIMKWTSCCCQSVVLKHCASIVVEFLDTIQIITPNLY